MLPALLRPKLTDAEGIADERSLDWVLVVTGDRDCQWFELLVPGASFEWHLDTHQRRREHGGSERWQWARLVAGAAEDCEPARRMFW